MITREGKATFKNFRILLDGEFSSKSVMRRLIYKLNPKKYYVVQWHIQAGNITTNLKVKIYFTLPDLSPTKIVMWDFHVDDSSKVKYYINLGRDKLTALVLNLKFS